LIGLGIDAGGTSTRWGLASAAGETLAEGSVGALSGLMMTSPESAAQFEATLQSLRYSLPLAPNFVWMGMTGAGPGFDAAKALQLAASALQLQPAYIRIASDMMMLHQLHLAPGAGHLLYAGTGSYASYWDASGKLHRVGGRGALLDDAGSGCWIGLEALRAVWRAEEAGEPRSILAEAVFAHIGKDDWASTRALVYGQALSQARGGIAALARVVGMVEAQDAAARAILQRAGQELARLALASLKRHGKGSLALAGRVLLESSTVQSSFATALLQGGFTDGFETSKVHIAQAAAIRAARGDVPDRQQSLEA
jgi:N-acetylglucosamine kinase-like BadF-type ATPase